MAIRASVLRELPTELLWNLTLRETRSKYKRSTLGWLWSVINPLATVGTYAAVFGTIMRVEPPRGDPSGLHMFLFYLVTGLMPWTFLANGLNSAAGSITGNEGLVKKVYFPREVLPASSTLALLFTFGIEMIVVGVALLIFGNMILPWVPLVMVVMVLQTGFVFGIGLLLAAANSYFRDVQHFLSIAIQVWFYATPIIYPPELALEHLPSWTHFIIRLNPMWTFVHTYRNLLYDLRWPEPTQWLTLVAITVGTLAVGWWGFRRVEPTLAEEL